MESNAWFIDIQAPFGGLAPAYWANTYASFGTRNQARDMVNIDLSDPTCFKQGPGLSNLTNGTQAGVLTTLPAHILPTPPSAGTSYAVGGNKLYQISSSAVTSDATWPHTIDKAAVTSEDGKSLFYINGALYYIYNHSGNAGDIGKYDLASTFDDDWGSTTPTGAAALNNAPHPVVVGNDNVAYFGNGAGVGYYDPDDGVGGTLSALDLDVPTGSQCVDVRYLNSRVWAAVNFPNTSSGNQSVGIIYVWAGVGVSSWDDFPNPRIQGKIGAIYPFNSTMFVWYQEVGFTGGYKLGYVRGNAIQEVASYSGSLPDWSQVFEHQGMLAWVSDGKIYRWGSSHRQVPVVLSQYMDCGYATVGAVATPFGTVMAASTDGGSNFRLANASGFDTTSSWKSLMFQVGRSQVDRVILSFNSLESGARVDALLRADRGLSSVSLAKEGQTGSISYTSDAGQVEKSFSPQFSIKDEFSIEFDYASGSASKTVEIRRIRIWGHTTPAD